MGSYCRYGGGEAYSCSFKSLWCIASCSFHDDALSLTTKRFVYQACVLSVVLYGGECWTPYKRHLVHLNCFHHRCIRTIPGLSRKQQWKQQISSESIHQMWGYPESITEKLIKSRLEWLGHLVKMEDPKKDFTWLVIPETSSWWATE